MIHLLLSKSFNVFSDEVEISLIGLDWVAKIILIDVLFVVSQEGSDSFDARGGL